MTLGSSNKEVNINITKMDGVHVPIQLWLCPNRPILCNISILVVSLYSLRPILIVTFEFVPIKLIKIWLKFIDILLIEKIKKICHRK